MTLRAWLAIAVIGLGIALVVLASSRLEGEPPRIGLPQEAVLGREVRRVSIDLEDPESGLRSVEVTLEHPGGSRPLESRLFSGSLLAGGAPGSHRQHLEIDLDPAALGLPDGTATLRVTARDWSWRGGLSGNTAEATLPLTVDTRAPQIEVESGLTYVQRGGSGVLLYRVDEPPARDGIRVGDVFFRGYPAGNDGRRVVIFAVPVEGEPGPTIRVVAEDAAGNAASSGTVVRILERDFAHGKVGLPQGFLDDVAVPLARANGIDDADPVEAFRRVNTELRSRNEAKIREIVGRSDPVRHFSGPFEQWSNSAVRSRFAEFRQYEVDGRSVSQARHYGFDLASTAHAPVTAANAGVVVFAGDLGIYGNCVVIDHGLGVHSLYAHMSQIAVREGESVDRGQTLGRSGATGLAGGDHLHFAMLVGDQYVDPLEWWDPRWVETHVDARLGPGSGGAESSP